MKEESSVGVLLVEENAVQFGCKTRVDSSVKGREAPLVDSYHPVTSDRLISVSQGDGQPCCEMPTVKSQISALYPIDFRNIVEPSSSLSCIRSSRPRRRHKLSHSHLKMLGEQLEHSSEPLRIESAPNSLNTPCHIQSSMNGPSVESPSPRSLENSLGTVGPISVWSGQSLLNTCKVDDGKSRKRGLSPSGSNRESSINADSANSCEMPRASPNQTCRVDSTSHNCEIDQERMTDESSEVKYSHTTVETPPKVHTYNTTNVNVSFSRPFISITPLKLFSVSSISKTIKFSNSCREDSSRQPLRPILNTNRIRIPKRSGVRVVARKDLSPLGATNHPAARTRLSSPLHRVVGGRKHREYLRLRAMLPAPRRRVAVSKVSVVCEAARHIEQLHGALIRRFRERLPPALAGCGLSSSDVGQRNIRQLVLRVLAAYNPGSLPAAPLENARSHQSPPNQPRGGNKRR